MIPAFAAPLRPRSPTRMAFLYVPNGIVMDEWTPQRAARGRHAAAGELPRIIGALAPYRNDVHDAQRPDVERRPRAGRRSGRSRPRGRGLSHRRASQKDLRQGHPGRRLDGPDRGARSWKAQTRFASLELGCEEGIQGGNCDNGYSCAYSNSISWRTPSSPNAAGDPPARRLRAAVRRGGRGARSARRARQELYEKSILDVVLEDAQTAARRRSAAPIAASWTSICTAIREIEKRIQKTERTERAAADRPRRAVRSVPTDFDEHARIMFDLMTLAFQTDSTRVVTFLLGIEQSPRSYARRSASPKPITD